MIYKLKTNKQLRVSSYEDGSLAFVTRDEDLLAEAKSLTGREKQENLLLKIFHIPVYAEPEFYYWGKLFSFKELGQDTRSPLLEAIKIQNLFAFHGLAPKTYGIFIYRNPETKTDHYALLMDDVGVAEYEKDKDWDIKYIRQSSDFGDREIYHCFNKGLAK